MTLSRKRLLEIGAGAGAFGSIAILRRPADAAQFSLKLANDQTPTHPMNVATAEAIKRIGIPALSALVEVEQKGEQLHIRNSPLCIEGGQSSCKFFSGYLEGLLGPAILSDSLSVFAVCCRSCGADECVLAISD